MAERARWELMKSLFSSLLFLSFILLSSVKQVACDRKLTEGRIATVVSPRGNMASSGHGKCTTIPRTFSWVLPVQSLVTGVAIYSTVYVFKVGSTPFILAVAAAGVQFILGLYCCFTANKPGIHHAFVMPIVLLALAGVWCGPLYYFSHTVDIYLKLVQLTPLATSAEQTATWSYVGLATTALNVLLAFLLLGIFLVEGMREPKPSSYQPPMAPNAYGPSAGYAMSPTGGQYQQQQHHVSQQQQQQQQQQQPHVMTGIAHAPTQMSPHAGYDNKYTPTMTTTAVASTPVSPVGSPAPTTVGSPVHQYQYQQQQQQQQQQAQYYPYDRNNRIDVIRRLCVLQMPDGHWEYSRELAELLKQWGGRDLMAPAHGVTALAQACLTDLCNYIWAAQRDGAEHSMLSPAELHSLQAVNWDLTWAKNALDRATAWMSGFR